VNALVFHAEEDGLHVALVGSVSGWQHVGKASEANADFDGGGGGDG
jgi:hypothetical protein